MMFKITCFLFLMRLSAADCGTDSDCPTNEICAKKYNFCTEGCREDSDCPSGQLCNAEADPQYWPTCDENYCRVDDDCPQGSMCLKPSWLP